MTYELAEQLKNAGFEQGELRSDRFQKDEKTNELTLIPTLRELIDACGEDFVGMYLEINGKEKEWEASGCEDKRGKSIGVNGKTPEEAVANLYLKLNERK